MAYTWHAPTPAESFHPRLDPVSAWLFSQQSAFLQSGEARNDAAMLYAMGLDADGFDPRAPDAFRALSLANPVNREDVTGHPFSDAELSDIVGAQASNGILDPRVHVVPLPNGGPRAAEDLRETFGIGTPTLRAPATPMPKPKAIIGIIDHGINIFHHRFRRVDQGSRVAFAWMQGAQRADNGRIRFGRERIQTEIEAAQIAAGDDEDALLRQIGVDFTQPGYRPLGFRASHGTHVLDLAAGFDPADETGSDFPIIAVTLPPEVTRETSGSMLAIPFALGLEYIADRARRIMAFHQIAVPVYVNFSFGLSGGPRDGRHRLEQTIARVADHHRAETGAGFTVVTAAGNNNLARGHAQAPDGADRMDLRWQIQPGDPSANFLEIRVTLPELPADTVARFALTVTPPGRPALDAITLTTGPERAKSAFQVLRRNGDDIGQASIWHHSDTVLLITLAIHATDPRASARLPAPAGEWGVSLHSETAVPTSLGAWILRDDVPGGFRDTGRQSYLIDPDYAERDARGFLSTDDTAGSLIRRAGTLNAFATANREKDITAPDATARWVVGGYQSPTQAAPYSATPGRNEALDVSARSDCSAVRAGVKAAGTRSGTRIAISGTSVAVPQVLRHFAIGDGVFAASSDPLLLGQHVLLADTDALCGVRKAPP